MSILKQFAQTKLVKRLVIAALVVSVVCNALLAYAVIDQSVSLTYLKDSYDEKRSSMKILAELCLKSDISKTDIIVGVQRIDSSLIVAQENCSIVVNELRFNFDNHGKVATIDTDAYLTATNNCGNK